ncbi:hypothetical protein M9Y10_043117 [Tritrichomonas musculus]|uniref:Uncharacterized protein n=1 Tax=Tritrichomonas musculus TaxID=1915356 RepID=A0ABR2JYU7_9EUKA
MSSKNIPKRTQSSFIASNDFQLHNLSQAQDPIFSRSMPRRSKSSSAAVNDSILHERAISIEEQQLSPNNSKLWTPNDFKIAYLALHENK